MESEPSNHKESFELFDKLFPNGLTGRDIKTELIPKGWERSSFKTAFHPSPEQSYKEHKQMTRRLNRISNRDQPETTFEEFKENFEDRPVKPEQELRELMGLCLWDIISNNHDTVTPAGRITYFGSFRASAGVIADWLNERTGDSEAFGYLDFYMGTSLILQRTDLTPVYRLIFNRFHSHGCDWIYHFQG